jgi:site-specific recombinase XerD
MLTMFYSSPSRIRRYLSLPIFGSVVDGFSTWLADHGYDRAYATQRLCLLEHLDSLLSKRGIRCLRDIDQADLIACRKRLIRLSPGRGGTTSALERYLYDQHLLNPPSPRTATGVATKCLAAYVQYLKTVQAAAASTIRHKRRAAAELFAYLQIERDPARMKRLTINDVEAFIKKTSRRLSRRTLQGYVALIRSFLRFLASEGHVRQGLDHQIDAPRVYQQEQLPRSLPWETVRAFLNSIDRSNLCGLRDFTMFLMMAVYGLRASDIVAMTLDDVDWRARKISIYQQKTGIPVQLPLTDLVGTALHKYLKKAPPPSPFREIFLRMQAPTGTLQAAALGRAFRVRARRGGVDLPGRGSCHRIRHSYAVFLLRKGTSVKTIGDILGHRTVESTSTYLRLAIEDLRDVGLPVPTKRTGRRAVRP